MSLCLAPPTGCVALLVALAAGCAHDAPAAAPAAPKEAAATKLACSPVAVKLVEAPGFHLEDLTARLRDSLAFTSGAPVIDELAVRAELAGCTEAPCPDAIGKQYRDARYFVASSLSRVGDTFIATVRVQQAMDEMARESAEAKDARIAIEDAGRAAGKKLRARLIADGVPLVETAPPTTDGSPAEGTEKSE